MWIGVVIGLVLGAFIWVPAGMWLMGVMVAAGRDDEYRELPY